MLGMFTRQRRPDDLLPKLAVRTAIHIGMPKTATKLLQLDVFAKHSQIHYLGKETGVVNGKEPDAATDKVIEGIVGEPLSGKKLAERQRIFVEQLIAGAGQKLVMWSSEQHTRGDLRDKQMEARNFRAVFGEAKVLLVLRHPIKYAESMYFQKLKAAHVGHGWEARQTVGYFTIDQWFESRQTHKMGVKHLNWRETIEVYRSTFGRDNLKIMLFEQLVENNAAYLTEISEFLGIDAAESISLCSNKRKNDRWTVAQIENLKRISATAESRNKFAKATKKEKLAMLGIDDDNPSPGEKAKADISDAWRQKLIEMTRDATRMLAQEGVPVEKYGYPM